MSKSRPVSLWTSAVENAPNAQHALVRPATVGLLPGHTILHKEQGILPRYSDFCVSGAAGKHQLWSEGSKELLVQLLLAVEKLPQVPRTPCSRLSRVRTVRSTFKHGTRNFGVFDLGCRNSGGAMDIFGQLPNVRSGYVTPYASSPLLRPA